MVWGRRRHQGRSWSQDEEEDEYGGAEDHCRQQAQLEERPDGAHEEQLGHKYGILQTKAVGQAVGSGDV